MGSGLSIPAPVWNCKWDWLEEAVARIFGWAPPAQTKLCLEISVEVGTPLARQWSNSAGRVWFITQLFFCHKLDLLPRFLLPLWGSISLLHLIPGFQVEAFQGVMELLIGAGPHRTRGLELTMAWRGGALSLPWPTSFPRMGFSAHWPGLHALWPCLKGWVFIPF